jgi:hypothetical protein
MSLKHALLASVFTVGLTAQTHAADVTADQAKAVADQLRGFLTGLLTERVTIPADLINVTPAGPAYKITVQSDTTLLDRTDTAGKATNAWLTTTVRPTGGTIWHIDSLTMPASYRLTAASAAALGMLMPPAPGVPAPQKPATVEWKVASQTATGDYDTALASDCHLDVQMNGITYVAQNVGPGMDSRTSVDKMTGRYLLHPNGSGGIDYHMEGTMDGYSMNSSNPTTGDVAFKAKHVVARIDAGAVMNGQIGTLIRTAITLALNAEEADAKGPDAKAEAAKAAHAALRPMIAMLKSIMSGMKLEETFEGVTITTAPGSANADSMSISFGGQAPGDTLKAFMALSLAGLKVAGLPPDMAEFVPRSIVVHPTVSNIDVKALTQLANDAAADDADPDMAKAQLLQLLTGGGVKVGFEHFDADLGFASMTGTGEATIVGPSAVQGTADIVVKGFDALMARAAKTPNGKEAMAVLALAKGFGKTDGDRTVWHIAITPDNKILVNGVDVTGGGAH